MKDKTPTELLHLINKIKIQHEELKNEVGNLLNEVNEKEILINKKLKEIELVENNYVKLIEELSNRNNG